jgi:hypothetical protein
VEKQNRKLQWFIPRLQDILFFSIFVAGIAIGPRMLNMDGDLPKHLSIGKYIVQGHLPPINDIFSYTRFGAPFAPHKWLSGVLFYLSYLLFDERGIVILSTVCLALTFTLLYTDAVSRTRIRLPLLVIVLWGAAVSSLHWIARPHIFTMLLLAIWLILNEKLASGQKIRLWYFPALMLLWNNIHGEFISGFLVTLACLGGWVWDYLFQRETADIAIGKRIASVLGLMTVVTILNPVSFQAWSTLTSWMGNDYLMSHTQETVSPDFQQGKYLILLALVAFSIFLLAVSKERTPARMGFLLAGFSAMALMSARNVHLYGVVAPFVLAGPLAGSLAAPLLKRFEGAFEQIESQARGIVWPVITVTVGIILLAVTPLGSVEHFSPGYFPVQAVKWLKTNPQEGNMFNPFDWGGYISFELYPDERVFIDSQGDVYGEAFIREYEQVITLTPGWQDVLNKYNVRWAIVPRNWPLASALAGNGWTEVYQDDTAMILIRDK